MKNILIITLLCMLTLVCSCHDQIDCLSTVRQAYPNAEIRQIPNSGYRFLVRQQDGSIIVVITGDLTNAEITSSVTLMGPITKAVDAEENKD